MRMTCDGARRELMRSDARVSDTVARHLETCSGCEGFARRMRAARAGLRAHRTHFEPDAAFAARVTAALPASSGDDLSWAALRLLPAALALALALGVWSWWGTASPTSLATETTPTDDVLVWVLENGSDS